MALSENVLRHWLILTAHWKLEGNPSPTFCVSLQEWLCLQRLLWNNLYYNSIHRFTVLMKLCIFLFTHCFCFMFYRNFHQATILIIVKTGDLLWESVVWCDNQQVASSLLDCLFFLLSMWLLFLGVPTETVRAFMKVKCTC
jgi:hypothetical protein